MSRGPMKAVPVIALPLLLAVTPATAEQMDLQSPVPERQDRSKHSPGEPSPRPDLPDAGLYPYRPPVPYRPSFVPPLTKEAESGRMGVAIWTSPNTPAGSRGASDPDNAGWLGFGVGMEWYGSKKGSVVR
jgi:hypothetical protein